MLGQFTRFNGFLDEDHQFFARLIDKDADHAQCCLLRERCDEQQLIANAGDVKVGSIPFQKQLVEPLPAAQAQEIANLYPGRKTAGTQSA